jgi:hypothetical protein
LTEAQSEVGVKFQEVLTTADDVERRKRALLAESRDDALLIRAAG